MAEKNVLRFHVIGEQGRRSCEWRMWTGSRKPTDDVYLAPARLGGELKVSLHRDGKCFHVFDASIRRDLRTGDRHALDAWQLATEARVGWRVGYRLRFPESQLETGLADPAAGSMAIEGPSPDTALVLTVLIGDAGALSLEGGLGAATIVGRLARKSGGEVLLVASREHFDPNELEEVVSRLNDGTGWSLPRGLSEKVFGWTTEVAKDGTRSATEYCFSRYVNGTGPLELPRMHPFRGLIRPWGHPELPAHLRVRSDICGVLVCGQGDAVLFVDDKARCDHSALGDTAEQLRMTHVFGRRDSAWMLLEGGRWATCLMTPALFQESDLAGLLPNGRRVAGFPARRR